MALVALAVAALGLLLHRIPTSWKPTIVLTTFAHDLMWAAPVAVILAGLGRRWILFGIAVVVMALMLLVQVAPNRTTDAPSAGPRLTVLQANLRLGHADPRAVVKLVKSHDVDLLATEELTDGAQDALEKAGISALLPFRFTAPLPDGGGGLGMWSRYPLSNTINEPAFWLGILHATVSLPQGPTMTFAAVHLTPPYPYPARRWNAEIAHLRALLPTLTAGPVIAAGDYNATTDHQQFRALMRAGFADGADQAGAGYQRSYPADRWFGPLIAIDHVLTRSAVATSVETVDLPGSDHRGLLARVTLR
ncbi:MAG: endonuclease/exonuclease/phosphatase family protein [Jatrophihabitans sp.]